MAHKVDPSLGLRDDGIPPSGGYWVAFMGIDYMASGDPRTFARIANHPALARDAKLSGTLGLSADEFHDRFEAERRRYAVPGRYECPR